MGFEKINEVEKDDDSVKFIMVEEDLIPDNRLKLSTETFLMDECSRCQQLDQNEKAKNDPRVAEYFYKKYREPNTSEWIKSKWFGIQEGCPVCNRKEEDVLFFAEKYIKLVKNAPMFMNSPNKSILIGREIAWRCLKTQACWRNALNNVTGNDTYQ